MEKSDFAFKVSRGILVAVTLTTISLLIYSLLMNYVDFSLQATKIVYMVISCLSVVLGSMYASRKNGQKGWLCGFGVAIGYMAILLIITSLLNNGSPFNLTSLVQVIIACAVGVLSGMLGINI